MTVAEDLAQKIHDGKSDEDDDVRHVISKMQCLDPDLLNRNEVDGTDSEAGSVQDQSHDNGLS